MWMEREERSVDLRWSRKRAKVLGVRSEERLGGEAGDPEEKEKWVIRRLFMRECSQHVYCSTFHAVKLPDDC